MVEKFWYAHSPKLIFFGQHHDEKVFAGIDHEGSTFGFNMSVESWKNVAEVFKKAGLKYEILGKEK